ncbi:MAG: TetR/AcrR family transcriptional regulator [Gammaproteobacteria bacterium]
MGTTETSRWQRRKEDRPAEILDAALALFTEKGFAASRIDDVAARAGVAKGTVYVYFDSKDALFKAMVKRKLGPQLERAEHLVNTHQGSAAALLEKLARQWWHALQHTDLSGLPKLIVAEAGNFPELASFFVENVVQRVRGLVARIIQQGMASGEFRQTSAVEAARVFTSAIVFASIWQHSLAPYDSIPFDSEAYLQIHLENFIRGLQN